MHVLQSYDGPSTRHVCPQCGDKKSFTLYIDESGNKLADNVGRCVRCLATILQGPPLSGTHSGPLGGCLPTAWPRL